MYECKQSRGPAHLQLSCSNSPQQCAQDIQINEVLYKLWCVYLLHLTIFTISLLMSSFAQWCIAEEAGHDTTSCHIDILNFPLLKNYDDIRIQQGRHLPVDFCYTVYSTNIIRGALGRGPYNNSKHGTAYFVARFTEIQAGRDGEKVPQSCTIFPTSAILIKPTQNRKLKSQVTVSCLLWVY